MHSGILLLDKPTGLSSNAALQRVRGLFGGVKGGHVGSLDPLATGMLPICLGEATKVAGEIIAARKCYRFAVRLGTGTTTGDAEGAPIATAPVPALTRGEIEAVLAGFTGALLQVPPMYSALKRGGQPLYRLARAGVTVERAARPIEVSALRLRAHDGDTLELEALCSKGTYVRVLGEDIAAKLGTLGHLTALRRLYVEPFASEPMHGLEALEAACGAGDPAAALLPADWPLAALPAVRLTAPEAQRLLHGQCIERPADDALAAPTRGVHLRLYDADGRFLGIGEAGGEGAVRPRRLLNAVAPV
jgi:tRNA pseudouridine55 synthase